MSSVIDSIERDQLRKGLPSFNPGDRVRVHFQVIEGTRKRTQVFEGVVLRRQGSGARETFTVRKQSFGVGVERTFPLHSPKIEKLEVAARGDVRRAKLYYLRGRIGKAARVAERRWGIDDEIVVASSSAEPEAVDAEGVTQAEAEAAEAPAEAEVEGSEPEADEAAAAESETGPEAETEAAAETDAEAPEAGETEDSAASEDAEDEEPAEARRLRRGLGLKLSIPKPKTQRRRAGRAGRHRRAGAGPGAGDPGLARSSPTRSPRNRWSRRSTSASGSSSTASSTTSTIPAIGDIVVFHPPAGADNGTECGVPHAPRRALPEADRRRVEPELHQADRRRARRHAQRPRRPPGRQRGREDRRALHQPLRRGRQPAICRKRSPFHPTTTS